MENIIFFNGHEVCFDLERSDFAALFGDENLTDSLVQFNPSTNKVTVDTRASCFYADFAGLHECICCGKYGDLAPKGAEGIDRCGLIDIMLLDYMSDEFASVYREKRIEMYKTLIEKNLNPKLNDRFERAIAILEKK